MISFLPNDTQRFQLLNRCFRFGADVRSGDSPLEAQIRMIRDSEDYATRAR